MAKAAEGFRPELAGDGSLDVIQAEAAMLHILNVNDSLILGETHQKCNPITGQNVTPESPLCGITHHLNATPDPGEEETHQR